MGLIKMYARPITYKVNGPGTEETAEGFVATPVRYSTISVEDLADHISADSRVERSKVAVITDSLIKQIREMVLNGHKIVVPHLGSFKPKIKSQLAINPESVDAASFSAKVRFSPSVELKRDLQAARIEKTTLPQAPAAPTIDEQKASILVYVKSLLRDAISKKTGKPVPASVFGEDSSQFETMKSAANQDVAGVSAACQFEGVTYKGMFYLVAKNSATNTDDLFTPAGAFINNSTRMPSAWSYDEGTAIWNFIGDKVIKVTEPFEIE